MSDFKWKQYRHLVSIFIITYILSLLVLLPIGFGGMLAFSLVMFFFSFVTLFLYAVIAARNEAD